MSNERKEKNAPIKQSALAAGVITEAEKLQAQKNAARKRYRLMSMTLVAIIVVAVVLLLVRVAPDSLTQLLNPDSNLGTDSSAGQNGGSKDEEIIPEITKLESTVGGIKLTWEPVKGAGKYRVYVQDSDGTWSKVGDTTDTTFVYADATVGESYTFTIRGRDKYDTDYITEYNTTGWEHTFKPVPEITALESVPGGIKLTWEPVKGVGKYRVYAQTSNGTWSKVGDTADTSYVYADATVGKSYTFTIRGRDQKDTDFVTEYNTTGWEHTFNPVPEITALESVPGGIKLTWEPVNGVGKYRIYVQASDGSWSKVGDAAGTSFVYSDATIGESYTFTIRGRDKKDAEFITKYNTTGWKHTYKPVPEITALESVPGGILLTWEPIKGVGKYRVYVKTNEGWSKVGDTADTSFVYSDAVVGKSYTFTIRGRDTKDADFITEYNTTGWKYTYTDNYTVAAPIYLNEMTPTSVVGKLWTRSERSVGSNVHTNADAPKCWDDVNTRGHTKAVVKDNYGNVYTYGMHVDGADTQVYTITFTLNGLYTRFSGVCACPEKAQALSEYAYKNSTKYTKYFEVYGDGRLLFATKDMRFDYRPESFVVDVTGVKELVILYPASDGPNEIATLYDGFLQ